MIREDYIIGWIKRYIRWLAEIAGFVQVADYELAARRADLALRELLGLGADSVLGLTEGEILARLAVGDPPPVVRDKCLLVAALLYHLGETATGRGNPDLARDCWLKSIQVVLGTHLHGGLGEGEWPEHVPTLTTLLERLKDTALPARTEAALIMHYEQRGEFDLAENALFRLLNTIPPAGIPAVVELGTAFYGRLSVLSDEALRAGNLSQAEVHAGLAELRARAAPAAGAGPAAS